MNEESVAQAVVTGKSPGCSLPVRPLRPAPRLRTPAGGLLYGALHEIHSPDPSDGAAMGFAAQLMRRILVDHARRHGAVKRGRGMPRLPLKEGDAPAAVAPLVDWLALDRALDRLATLDQRQVRIVELRFFGGLSLEETAEALEPGPVLAIEPHHLARGEHAPEVGLGVVAEAGECSGGMIAEVVGLPHLRIHPGLSTLPFFETCMTARCQL